MSHNYPLVTEKCLLWAMPTIIQYSDAYSDPLSFICNILLSKGEKKNENNDDRMWIFFYFIQSPNCLLACLLLLYELTLKWWYGLPGCYPEQKVLSLILFCCSYGPLFPIAVAVTSSTVTHQEISQETERVYTMAWQQYNFQGSRRCNGLLISDLFLIPIADLNKYN